MAAAEEVQVVPPGHFMPQRHNLLEGVDWISGGKKGGVVGGWMAVGKATEPSKRCLRRCKNNGEVT